MAYKKSDFLKLDLTPQRTSSYLSERCGKISFNSMSFEEESPKKSFFSDDSTLRQYFNNFEPKMLNPCFFQKNYNIYIPETTSSIVYNNEPTIRERRFKEKEILYLSFEKFIEIISSLEEKSEELFEVCLYGYLSFSDDETIFKELIKRFHVNFPLNMTKSEKSLIYDQKIMIIQKKVLVFFQFWIEIYKENIVINKTLDRLFEETLFILYRYKNEFTDCHLDLSKLLISLEEVRVYKNFKKFNETNFLAFKNKISCCLIDVALPINYYIQQYTKDVVEQICIFDFDNFYKISIPELLKKKNIGGENYNYFANHFNNLSKVLTFILLWCNVAQKRILLFEKIVDIIDLLIKNNNYNSAFACFLALNHSSIDRLEKVIHKKIRKGIREKMIVFGKLFDTSNNHFNLREAQKKMMTPCVPFLGLYVKDLLNLEENGKLNDFDKKMINFKKCCQISMIIKEIDNFKEVWYDFEKIDEIYDHFKYLPDIPDDLLYELSYKILPFS